MTRCYIGVGGNRGDVFQTMTSGLNELDGVNGVRVVSVSPVYQTAPVGPEKRTFLNAAAELKCELSPRDLLHRLQAVEDRYGRTRDARWGPRPLDLDILLFGDSVIAQPKLTTPHPHLWYRRFVLDPLHDIAPRIVHPVFGTTIGKLRASLLQRPLPVMLSGGETHEQRALRESVERTFPAITLVADLRDEDELPEGLIVLDLASDESLVTPPTRKGHATIAPAANRCVRLDRLPGSRLEAAESVLTAALDCPGPYSRPLRRMP